MPKVAGIGALVHDLASRPRRIWHHPGGEFWRDVGVSKVQTKMPKVAGI